MGVLRFLGLKKEKLMNGEVQDRAIDAAFSRLREQAHNITGQVNYTHALVEHKHRSIRAAEAALAVLKERHE